MFDRISRHYRFSLILLLLVILTMTSSAFASNSFESDLSEAFADSDMVGLAVAVVRGDKLDLVRTFGKRELGDGGAINQKTRFRIASLSKAFAATLALQLEQEGKLSLDDKAVKASPQFKLKKPTQANSVTLRDVLSHRLSLPPYAYDNLLEAGTKPQKILSEMRHVQPICSVGSCYAYQNVGFNMIANAISLADRKSYSDSLSKRILEPLAMSGASLGKAGLIQDDNWARSYKRRKAMPWRLADVRQAYYDVPAAGGVNANIIDMAKWLSAQMGGAPEVLPADLLSKAQQPQVETRRELRRIRHMVRTTRADYGLGWRIYQYAGATLINHSGSVEGYGAQIAFLPEKKVGIVLLTNSKSKEFWGILPMFLDHELGFIDSESKL